MGRRDLQLAMPLYPSRRPKPARPTFLIIPNRLRTKVGYGFQTDLLPYVNLFPETGVADVAAERRSSKLMKTRNSITK